MCINFETIREHLRKCEPGGRTDMHEDRQIKDRQFVRNYHALYAIPNFLKMHNTKDEAALT